MIHVLLRYLKDSELTANLVDIDSSGGCVGIVRCQATPHGKIHEIWAASPPKFAQVCHEASPGRRTIPTQPPLESICFAVVIDTLILFVVASERSILLRGHGGAYGLQLLSVHLVF